MGGSDMAVSPLRHAQIVTGLASMHRPNEPMSGGARVGAAATENWDSLFRLIMARLRLTAGDGDTEPSMSAEGKALRGVQTSVLECLSALGVIYEVLRQEKRRRNQLEQEVFEARTTIARVYDEIARAQIAGRCRTCGTCVELPGER